jgi:RNA polymerase sigma-70 factor (ECF subfamily)
MHTTLSDAELAVRFRNGDDEIVRAVYRRYAGPMLSVARGSLRDRELAQEAVQQAFLQAWRAAGSYDPARPLSSWLFSITRRVCIDLYRRERRQAVVMEADDLPTKVAEDDVGLSVERAWQAWEVRQALDTLGDGEREVVRLSHLEGLSLPETAERLGIPVGTVKSRSHRAYRRLGQELRHLRSERVPVGA